VKYIQQAFEYIYWHSFPRKDEKKEDAPKEVPRSIRYTNFDARTPHSEAA